MRSNSPFRKDSCAEQKAKMKAKYKKDFGNLKEYEKEVKAFGCVKGKWQSNLKYFICFFQILELMFLSSI